MMIEFFKHGAIVLCFLITILVISKCEHEEIPTEESIDDLVILKSNNTTVVGRKLYTVYENKPYAAFWRVPFAEPPVKHLRFKPPKPHAPWLTNFTYDYSRPHTDTCSSGITEDCLYLSIYMPVEEHMCRKQYYPVFVWVHEDAHSHDPDFFIDEDVLVVTVSYRTGITGFLNTGDSFAPGNMGAKDIIMALKWIRENITLFNGDINKVTLAGSGNAAVIVGATLLSDAADDLYNRVIIQSGSALSPADFEPFNFEILNKLYWRLNGPFSKLNPIRLQELLEKTALKDLHDLSEDLYDSTEVRDKQRLINSFGPSIEVSKKEAFMNKSPLEVYKRGMANNNVDVVIGFTSLEALYKLKGFVENRKLLKYLNYNFQYLLPFEGEPDEYGSKRYKSIRRKILDFYFVNGTIAVGSLKRYAKYVSDQVIYPLVRQARLQALASCNNVYLYRFAFKGSLNIVWDSRLNYTGATAGDEICYLFKCKSANEVYRSGEIANERQFIKKIARLWANFAKCGNPTPIINDEVLGNLHWQPLTPGKHLKAMNFGKKIKMVTLPEEKRIKFWDELKSEFFPEANPLFEEPRAVTLSLREHKLLMDVKHDEL